MPAQQKVVERGPEESEKGDTQNWSRGSKLYARTRPPLAWRVPKEEERVCPAADR